MHSTIVDCVWISFACPKQAIVVVIPRLVQVL